MAAAAAAASGAGTGTGDAPPAPGVPAMVCIAFLFPDHARGGTVVTLAPDMTVTYHVVRALAAKMRVNAADTRLYPLPSWVLSGGMPTTDAIAAAVAGMWVPPTTPVTTLSQTHGYAALLGSPLPAASGVCATHSVPRMLHLT